MWFDGFSSSLSFSFSYFQSYLPEANSFTLVVVNILVNPNNNVNEVPCELL